MNTESFDPQLAPVGRDKLVEDLKAVVRDAEDLIRVTADDLGDKTREARDRLNEAIDSAKDHVDEVEATAAAGAKATDELIREHPYPSLGIAFGIGLLLGVILNRR